MSKYLLTNKALEDLKNIWVYTLNNWSEFQADKYYNELLNNCSDLAENKKIGRRYYEISNEIYGLKSGKHIIFYKKVSENKILVIRFLHISMDINQKLKS